MKPINWFGIIVLYTVLTLLFAHFIPSDSPFSVLNYVYGFIFVTFVPGYCLVTVLFQKGKLDVLEKSVLSVALSFSIVGLLGLFLGLSPIGITTTSVAISLSSIVLVLGFIAFIRKLREFQMQGTEKVSS